MFLTTQANDLYYKQAHFGGLVILLNLTKEELFNKIVKIAEHTNNIANAPMDN